MPGLKGSATLQDNLVPLELLFGNPQKDKPQVSPDGTKLAYIAPSEQDVLNIWVSTVDGSDARMVTHDSLRGIGHGCQFEWTADSKHILYTQDQGGNENWQLKIQALDGSEPRNLTPFEGVRASNLVTDKDHPDEAYISLNKEDSKLYDVYKVTLSTGDLELVCKNPGFVMAFHADSKFKVRAAMAKDGESGDESLRIRDSDAAEWRTVSTWSKDEIGEFVDFSEDGAAVYFKTSVGSDTARLAKLSAKDGSVLEEIASDPKADAGKILHDPDTNAPVAVAFDRLKSKWTVVDKEYAKDFEMLAKLEEGVFFPTSHSHDNKIWTVLCVRGAKPPVYYLYDRATQKAKLLFVTSPELERYEMGAMECMTYSARDGLDIPAYLTLPILQAGEEAKTLPMVLLPHGGPWWRDTWGMNGGGSHVYWPYALATRGYAVLQPQFRGSAGFGKAFEHAGDRGWGVGPMQHDLTDAVRWAIDSGLADPGRIAIFGASYGGYATLAGLTFTPELYCAGVDLVGPSNIKTLFQSFPPYWKTITQKFIDRTGDCINDEEFNQKISPLFHIDNIRAPLLIGQGANDPRVVKAESDQIFEAMKTKGLPVSYALYPDEGHGFGRAANHLHFMSLVEQFCAKYLGGLATEPVHPKAANVKVM